MIHDWAAQFNTSGFVMEAWPGVSEGRYLTEKFLEEDPEDGREKMEQYLSEHGGGR